MRNFPRESRTLWLVTGVLAGLCISYFWPHEQVGAATADRDEKFAMITVPMTIAGIPGAEIEGVFVLDFLTGQIRGSVLNNKTGTFSIQYLHNLAADFQVDPTAEPHYAVVSGIANLTGRGRAQFATGVLYVGELTSGKVYAYGIPYTDANRPVPPMPLVRVDGFQFRQPVQ